MRSVLLDPVCVRISFTYEGFGTSIKGLTPCEHVGRGKAYSRTSWIIVRKVMSTKNGPSEKFVANSSTLLCEP